MKKLFLSLIVSVCTFGAVSAQDLGQVAEMYNAAAALLNEGQKAEALTQFESVLNAATALGESGAEIANNCKGIIPSLYMSVAKGLANENNIDKALETFKKAIETAKNFGDEATVAEAEGIIASLKGNQMMNAANALLNSKQFAEAAAAYGEIIAIDPNNANAYLRQGMALNSTGKFDEAITSLEKAVELLGGNEAQVKAAKKQLSNAFLKKANGAYKAKEMKDALEFALKSAEYDDNANAHMIAGNAAAAAKQNKIAAENYEAYLAISPNAKNKAQIIYQLATALMGMGDNAKACGYFKEIAQDEKFGEAARYQLTVLKCN